MSWDRVGYLTLWHDLSMTDCRGCISGLCWVLVIWALGCLLSWYCLHVTCLAVHSFSYTHASMSPCGDRLLERKPRYPTLRFDRDDGCGWWLLDFPEIQLTLVGTTDTGRYYLIPSGIRLSWVGMTDTVGWYLFHCYPTLRDGRDDGCRWVIESMSRQNIRNTLHCTIPHHRIT